MKKIIITGGATRIGAAIAKKLSGPNIEIVIHYNKSKSKAESLKKELKKNGTKIYLAKGDLSKETDVNKIIKFAKSKLKYFDCLINNASLFENDSLKNFTSKSWDNHLDVNEICNAVDFFIKNSSITGQVLAIDSGQNLNWQTPDVIGKE